VRARDLTCALCGRRALVVRHHPGAPAPFARGWALEDATVAAMAVDDGWLVGLCRDHAALDRIVDLAEAAEALGLSQLALDRRMRRHPGAWPVPVAVYGRLRLWWLADLVAAWRSQHRPPVPDLRPGPSPTGAGREPGPVPEAEPEVEAPPAHDGRCAVCGAPTRLAGPGGELRCRAHDGWQPVG
jgi:hypothetical protein